MFRRLCLLFVLVYFCSAVHAEPLTENQLSELLMHSDRFIGDKLRDSDRRPEKIMKFSGVEEGDVVLDLYAGGGWYTELYARAVGSKGLVYAQNDLLTWRFGQKEMEQRTSGKRLVNVIRLDKAAIADIDIKEKSVDIAFMAINYHDLFFTHRYRNDQKEIMRDKIVDYKESFEHVKKLLKDNGVLIVIDHVALPGSGYDAANTLHRIDPNIVKHQLEELGFTLLEEAFYLRNPRDDLKTLVFDEKIRGQTDRFILKFGK